MSAVVCPKCGSGSIVSALDEAPGAVTNWVKCLICAKRFDPTTVAKVVDDVATIKQAFDDWEAERAGDHDVEDSVEASMGDEELDVFDDRDDPDRQDSLSDLAMKDERVRRGGSKERTMSRGWTPERRAKFMATMQAKRGGRGRQKKAQAAVENVPAIIATKPARWNAAAISTWPFTPCSRRIACTWLQRIDSLAFLRDMRRPAPCEAESSERGSPFPSTR